SFVRQMDTTDSKANTARFYDDLGVREWLRLDSDARARVIFHLHKRVLERHVRRGDRVLDAGAGPGRFSVEVAGLGAEAVAGDISAVQVSLAREAFKSRRQRPCGLLRLTATCLPFADSCFDTVVCFGSVLSHCGAQAPAAAR